MAEVKVKARLDTGGFNAGIDDMKKSVGRFSRGLEKVKGILAAVFAVEGIRRFTASLIRTAAKFEDLTAQFRVLLRSGKDARALFRELKEFSAQTPFSLEDIAKASQTLITFSEGAMGGVNALRIFGDAAAATGQKFPDVAYWVGRLYAALASGRPFIDSANSLQRLRIMAPSTMKEMIALEAAGRSGTELWDTFTASIGKFEGGMATLAETVSGKSSTMKDNWRLAFGEMGEAFKPFTLVVLDGLTWLGRAVSAFVQGLQVATAHYSVFMSKVQRNKKGGLYNPVDNVRAFIKTIREGGFGDAGDEARAMFPDIGIPPPASGVATGMKLSGSAATRRAPTVGALVGRAAERDSLKKIGARLGGTVSPELDVARRALAIAEAQLKDQQKIVEHTREGGGMAA